MNYAQMYLDGDLNATDLAALCLLTPAETQELEANVSMLREVAGWNAAPSIRVLLAEAE